MYRTLGTFYHNKIKSGIATGLSLVLLSCSTSKVEIDNARVNSITPYYARSELTGATGTILGYDIKIDKDDRMVMVPIDRWDKSIKQGDLVDIVATAPAEFLRIRSITADSITDNKE